MSAEIRVDSTKDLQTSHGWELRVSGEVDISTVARFDSVIDNIIDEGARFVVLDLKDVRFLDSTGLRAIVRAADQLTAVGGRLTVAGLSGAAEQVLKVTGLLEHLRTEPKVDGAS